MCDLIIASTKNDSWNKDYGYGCIDAYKAMQILRGTYFEILNRRGFYSIAYGNSDYYVRTYPNTGISWKCSEGLSLRLNPSTYSVFVDPTFDSSSKQVSLSASLSSKFIHRIHNEERPYNLWNRKNVRVCRGWQIGL